MKEERNKNSSLDESDKLTDSSQLHLCVSLVLVMPQHDWFSTRVDLDLESTH